MNFNLYPLCCNSMLKSSWITTQKVWILKFKKGKHTQERYLKSWIGFQDFWVFIMHAYACIIYNFWLLISSWNYAVECEHLRFEINSLLVLCFCWHSKVRTDEIMIVNTQTCFHLVTEIIPNPYTLTINNKVE